MKKKVFGRRLKRDRNERKALFKSLISSLVIKGKIETTEEKAKAVRGDVDKMITSAKKGGRNLSDYIFPQAMEKLTNEIIPSLGSRNSGYTRLIKLSKRFSDNASMVVMEWVDLQQIREQKPNTTKGKSTKNQKKPAKPTKIAKASKKTVKPIKKETKRAKK